MKSGTALQRRLWWLVMGLVTANVLGLLLLILPIRDERNRQENQLLDLQRRVRSVHIEGASDDAVLIAFQEVEEFARGYPDRVDLVGIIGRLTKLVRSLALQVPAVTYHPSELKDVGLTKITLVMGVEGSYGAIRRLLYELEGMRRFLVIERLALAGPKGGAALQGQLQLAVYVR